MSFTVGGSFGGLSTGLYGDLGRVVPSGSQNPAPTTGAVMSQPGGWQSILQNLSGTALDWYKTTQSVDLANEQVKRGQYPTAIGQNGQLSGTANVSTSAQLGSSFISPGMLFAIAIVVVIVMLLKK